jgi:hypothetical protein
MTRVLSPHAAAAASTSALLVTSSVTGTIRSSSTATESALRAAAYTTHASRSSSSSTNARPSPRFAPVTSPRTPSSATPPALVTSPPFFIDVLTDEDRHGIAIWRCILQ